MQIQFIYWIFVSGEVPLLLAHFTWNGAIDSVPTLFSQIETHRILAQSWIELMAKKFTTVVMLERSYTPPRPIAVDMQP